MGIQLSWIAVKDGAMEDMLDRLGLVVIGEDTDELNLKLAFGRTEQGWSVLVMKKWPKKPDETVAMVAPKGSALYGAMTEIAMFSELRGFEDGRLSWSVTRDCDKEGVTVQGAPPNPFDDIRRRLEAKQAAAGEERVDYLFDLPPDLSTNLCGYEPYTGVSEWLVLGRKGDPPYLRETTTDSTLYPALEAGTKADLLPLLWSLGWSAVNDDPVLYQGDQITREIGASKQTILFSYGSGFDAHIRVIAWTAEDIGQGMTKYVRAYGGDDRAPIPWWKRFSWRRFWEMTQAPSPSIRGAVEQARADILELETYLKTGVRGPRVQIDVWEHPDSEPWIRPLNPR